MSKGPYRDRDGRILGVYGISHDITELREAHENLERTQEALFRSQKMEAVGQLTGGLAHDFNNILAIILGNLELLQAHLPHDPYTDEIVDAVMRATLHGKDLTAHLLAFSRRRLLNPQAVDVNVVVAGIVRLLGRTLGATISVTTSTSTDAGMAYADPAALEAAVLNVALNARDAMPDGGSLGDPHIDGRDHDQAGNRGRPRARPLRRGLRSRTAAAACRRTSWPACSSRSSRPRPAAAAPASD